MHDGHLLTNIQQQCWRIEVTFALNGFAAERHPRPLLYRPRHFLLHTLQGRGIDQRPHGDIVTLAWIPELYRFQGFAQAVHEQVINSFLYVDTLRAVTNLSGIDDPRIHNRFDRQFKIGIIHHNRWRLATQLQAHFGDIFRRSRHNLFTCCHAAGHADHRHFRVTGQFLADGFTTPQHQVKHTTRQTNLINNFGKRNRVIGREFAGFNHDGVPGQQGRSQLTGDQEEREIPRQDPGGNPQRALKQQDILARTIALQYFAFITTSPLRHIVEIVGSKRDFHLGQLLNFSSFSHN